MNACTVMMEAFSSFGCKRLGLRGLSSVTGSCASLLLSTLCLIISSFFFDGTSL